MIKPEVRKKTTHFFYSKEAKEISSFIAYAAFMGYNSVIWETYSSQFPFPEIVYSLESIGMVTQQTAWLYFSENNYKDKCKLVDKFNELMSDK